MKCSALSAAWEIDTCTRIPENGNQSKKSSMMPGFLMWVAEWMVEPSAEVRNFKGRCLGERKKGEEVNVSHAEFQVSEEHPLGIQKELLTQA